MHQNMPFSKNKKIENFLGRRVRVTKYLSRLILFTGHPGTHS